MVLKVGIGVQETVLMPGDILLKISGGSFVHNMIALGQFFSKPLSRHAKTVHAAIYTRDDPLDVNSGLIAESSGGGLLEASIGRSRPPHLRDTWKVYRFYGDGKVVDAAAEVASTLARRHATDSHFGTYNYSACLASVVRPSSNPIGGANAKGYENYLSLMEQRCFFCSNFVVACYAVGCEMAETSSFYAIPKNMENVTPGELADYFEKVDEGGGGGGWWKRLGGTRARLIA